jgi:hypothetical protein
MIQVGEKKIKKSKTDMEMKVKSYLDNHFEKGKEIGTIQEIAEELGTYYARVQRTMAACNYKRGADRILVRREEKHDRHKEIEELNDAFETYTFPDVPPRDDLSLHIVKCEQYLADNLAYFFKRAFPDEILSIFTNDDSLLIVTNPNYRPKGSEISFKVYLEDKVTN